MATVSNLATVTLLQAGLEPERDLILKYFSTHQSCLQQLQIGDIDACASGAAIQRVTQKQSGVALPIRDSDYDPVRRYIKILENRP